MQVRLVGLELSEVEAILNVAALTVKPANAETSQLPFRTGTGGGPFGW